MEFPLNWISRMLNMENGSRDIIKLFNTKPYLCFCAPMVRYSRLEFRLLVREYGVDVAYTPMILADSFCRSDGARRADFQTASQDHPLIVQFASNNGPTIVNAVNYIANECEGVDINCGCPQKWVTKQGLGADLLHHPESIEDMVKHVTREHPHLPCSIKIRIFDDLRTTVELVKRAEMCGISWVAVHCRTPIKGSSINYEALKIIRESVNIPTIANGDLSSIEMVNDVVAKTGVKGIMCARALLKNPSFFKATNVTPSDCIERYIEIASKYQTKASYVRNHLIFMTYDTICKEDRVTLSSLKSNKQIFDWLGDRILSHKVESLCISNRNQDDLDLSNPLDIDKTFSV